MFFDRGQMGLFGTFKSHLQCTCVSRESNHFCRVRFGYNLLSETLRLILQRLLLFCGLLHFVIELPPLDSANRGEDHFRGALNAEGYKHERPKDLNGFRAKIRGGWEKARGVCG